VVLKNVAREFFRFGSGMKKISRQKEKVLARVFRNCGSAIRVFAARVFHVWGMRIRSQRESKGMELALVSYFCTDMGRILAIDYGRKRTGLAVTDPLKIIPGGLTTVPTHTLLDFLRDYVSREPVERFVLGLPRRMNYEESESMTYIRPFAVKLAQAFPSIPITYVDERFTSRMAQRTILEAGIGKMKRRDKALVDEVSAVIILQSYLDNPDR